MGIQNSFEISIKIVNNKIQNIVGVEFVCPIAKPFSF